MNPPKERVGTINEYRMMEYNTEGEYREKKEHYDLLTVVLLCPDKETEEQRGSNPVLRLLGVLFSASLTAEKKQKILELEFGIPMTEQIEKEMERMCNLSEGIYDSGLQQGLQRGLLQGRKEGFEDGRSQGLLERNLYGIRNMMSRLQLPLEVAMDIMGVPEEEKERYTRLLMEEVQ